MKTLFVKVNEEDKLYILFIYLSGFDLNCYFFDLKRIIYIFNLNNKAFIFVIYRLVERKNKSIYLNYLINSYEKRRPLII